MQLKHLIKRPTAILLTAALITVLGACSNGGNTQTTSSQQENSLQSSQISEQSENSPDNSAETSENIESDTGIPKEWQDNGIFSAYYEEAYKLVKTMTLDEKIGQMLYARCPSENAVEIAQQYHIGGYVLFGRDFEDKTKDEVIADVTSYKYSQKIPMTISVDEEGGTVVRISNNENLAEHKFQSPRSLYESGGMDTIKSDTKEKSDLLSSLMIDTNLAPVCDISTNESDFMYDRSLGENAQTTAEYVSAVTKISQQNGVSATLKHFPGYGNNADTHTGIAVDERDYETFENNDFIPFKAGIDAGANLVMVSHNIVNCMDSTKPASISADVHNILRDKLGFTGIIVTDDLAMDAIRQYSGDYSPVVTAVLAGNDMLTVSDIESSFNDIKQAVNDSVIDESLIDYAVMRIISWKYSKNMLS